LIWLCFAKYQYDKNSLTEDGEHWNFAPHYYTDTWRSVKGDFASDTSTNDPSVMLTDSHHGRQLCWLAALDHAELGSAILNLALIIFYISLQIVSIPLYFFAIMLQILFMVIWFLVGVVLLVTKVDAMGTVWTTWFYCWTWTNHFAAVFYDPNNVIDTDLFNTSMFIHCFFYSIPNMVLQIINNALLKKPWTWYAILSVAVSGYLIIAGGYIFTYHRFCRSFGVRVVDIKDVPQILTLFGFQMFKLPPAEKAHPPKAESRGSADSYVQPEPPIVGSQFTSV